MNDNIQRVESLYHSNNYMFTPQRKIITTELLKSKKKHLSCGEIYGLVKNNETSIGLATVYRSIAILEEIGILRKAYIAEDKSVKYEICTDYENKGHLHLICKKCGSVIEMENVGIDTLTKEIRDNYKFNVTEHRANFYGVCNECKKKQ